jgi:hypothetical protein
MREKTSADGILNQGEALDELNSLRALNALGLFKVSAVHDGDE